MAGSRFYDGDDVTEGRLNVSPADRGPVEHTEPDGVAILAAYAAIIEFEDDVDRGERGYTLAMARHVVRAIRRSES